MTTMTVENTASVLEFAPQPVSDVEVQAWVSLAHRIADTAKPPARVEALYAAVHAFYRSLGSHTSLHPTNAEEAAQLEEVQNLLTTLQTRVTAAQAHQALAESDASHSLLRSHRPTRR
ncbi:MAG: hypothetical protein M3Y89_15015 [Actinomycetota bacterium]|nr:hypothetical protein [Actinomycetota bacterium]